MTGPQVERQLTPDQSKRLEIPQVARDINILARTITQYVTPHLPVLPRRNTKRDIAILGIGTRGVLEIGAVSLAIGPARITANDIDTIALRFSSGLWKDAVDSFGEETPTQIANSKITFVGNSIFFLPLKNQDVVFAFGVHPKDIVEGTSQEQQADGSWKSIGGVERIINMAKEDGGVVVFTKDSIGTTVDALREKLAPMVQSGDIVIEHDIRLQKGPRDGVVHDQWLFVVRRIKK